VLRCFARAALAALRKGGSLYAAMARSLSSCCLTSTSKGCHTRCSPHESGGREFRDESEGVVVSITASAGVACLGSGESAADVLACADAALYDAKHGGRNRLCAASPG
jgi:GGDEF domain-containing protein